MKKQKYKRNEGTEVDNRPYSELICPFSMAGEFQHPCQTINCVAWSVEHECCRFFSGISTIAWNLRGINHKLKWGGGSFKKSDGDSLG